MRMILLICSFVMLLACVVMAIISIKEKHINKPFAILVAVTFFIALFMLIKMLGV